MEPFNGDFIQRHARAAALFNDIYVIHVYGDASGRIRRTTTEVQHHDHLTEHIVYYPRGKGRLGKIQSGYRWLSLFRGAIKSYIRQHGVPDIVHVHIPIKAGIFGNWMKKKYGIPLVISEHWGIYNEIAPDNFTRRSHTFRRYTRRFFEQASLAVSPSRFLSDGVDQLVVKKKWKIIPNVVNTGLFHFVKPTGSQPFRFIHVSNMVPLKNPEGILQAMRILLLKHPSCELIMVGGKPESLLRLAAEPPMSGRVVFRDEIPYEQVAVEMKGADVLILFSQMENSPCVIGEALCCGLPVIVTRTGGIPELVDDSNSLQVAPGDVEALASAMETMIRTYDRFDRQAIAAAAVAKFSFPEIGRQFRDLYDEVLTSSSVS